MAHKKNRPKLTSIEGATYQRVPNFLEMWSPTAFYVVGGVSIAFVLLASIVQTLCLLLIPFWLLYMARGIADMGQTHHAVLRNYPVLGHMRYALESIRPELRQYFVEDDQEAAPYSRENRSVVYQRAKSAMDTLPFGTRHDLYEVGAEWLNHSLQPRHVDAAEGRVTVGGPHCTKPYDCSIFNVSAMSYGSLSRNAVLALNGGARLGDFYHNTGEGGISPYHLEPGGDLVWQIGTGYFGCRSADGGFDAERYAEQTAREAVRMVELKLSQGAKPAHGGILPAAKVTPEISRIRGVPMGKDVLSPPAHTAFSGPDGLIRFIDQLRTLAGGKPVGFKLCVGNPVEFMELVHAMRDLDLTPDFISVDGAEGGTGAAPVEFSNSVGMPLDEGLHFVHSVLIGAGLRDRITLISAGKIATGFHVVRQLALGADVCNSARAMMFALGCIQALKCNTNKCPVGVATQDPKLMNGLVVPEKAKRVANFHAATVVSALELTGAAGLASPRDLRTYHLMRRVSPTEVADLSRVHPPLVPGALLSGSAPEHLQRLWSLAERRYSDRTVV